MFWVFCNNCFVKPSLSSGLRKRFYITGCSHLFCEKCISQEAPFCRRCSNPCQVVECNANIPEEVKCVFTDLAQKAPLLCKTIEYQAGQRLGLTAHHRATEERFAKAKTYITELESKYHTMTQKYETAKKRISELEQQLKSRSFQRQTGSLTPRVQETSHLFSSLSFEGTTRSAGSTKSRTNPFTPKNCYSNINSPRFPSSSIRDRDLLSLINQPSVRHLSKH